MYNNHALSAYVCFTKMYAMRGMIIAYLQIFKPGARRPPAGLWLACAWFLKIDPVRIVCMRACVCVCVCVSVPEAINN